MVRYYVWVAIKCDPIAQRDAWIQCLTTRTTATTTTTSTITATTTNLIAHTFSYIHAPPVRDPPIVILWPPY